MSAPEPVACPTVHVVGQVVACLHAPGPHDGPHEYRPEMYRPRGPDAVPEPRSTPGPSTGTPEPSQAASEADWRHEIVVDALDNLVREHSGGKLAGYGADAATLAADFRSGALHLAASEACGGEVARLREALVQVRALCDVANERKTCRDAVYVSDLREALASVDAPAPDEADDCAVHCGDPSCAAPAVPAEGDEATTLDEARARTQAVEYARTTNAAGHLSASEVGALARGFHDGYLAAVSPVPAPDESR